MKKIENVTCTYVLPHQFSYDPGADMSKIVGCEGDDPRFVYMHGDANAPFLTVMYSWLHAKTKYVCYLPYGYRHVSGRFAKQLKFMEMHDLAASYGDVKHVRAGKDVGWFNYAEFHADMIGTHALPMESLVINREKLLLAGGFDYSIAGSYDPVRYLSAMIACAGRVMKYDDYVVSMTTEDIDPATLMPELSDMDPDVHGMFQRWRLDKWVQRARAHYRSMRW